MQLHAEYAPFMLMLPAQREGNWSFAADDIMTFDGEKAYEGVPPGLAWLDMLQQWPNVAYHPDSRLGRCLKSVAVARDAARAFAEECSFDFAGSRLERDLLRLERLERAPTVDECLVIIREAPWDSLNHSYILCPLRGAPLHPTYGVPKNVVVLDPHLRKYFRGEYVSAAPEREYMIAQWAESLHNLMDATIQENGRDYTSPAVNEQFAKIQLRIARVRQRLGLTEQDMSRNNLWRFVSRTQFVPTP
jgi:hypothetical protein